jgi:hypothetical protein
VRDINAVGNEMEGFYTILEPVIKSQDDILHIDVGDSMAEGDTGGEIVNGFWDIVRYVRV